MDLENNDDLNEIDLDNMVGSLAFLNIILGE